MSESTQTFHRSRFGLWHYALAAALVWTAFIAAALGWSVFEQRRGMLDNARHGAQVSFQQEMLVRFWVEGHDSSAPATNNAPPSSELARAAKRALLDSASMLRQIQGRSPESAGYRSRLTSVKPLRPENTPDAWEAGALQAFAQGETEVASVATMDGQEYMRVMRPLVTEAACLTCHGDQDYKVGEIHGGMSVSVLLAPLRAYGQRQLAAFVIVDAVIWVLGLGVIGFSARRMQARNLERARAETVLRDSEARYCTLADSGQALIWTSGPAKQCDYFNQPWLAFTGRTLAQELGDGWAEGLHPDDRARCLETFMAAFDRREAFSMVYRLRRHDGEFRWIQDDGTPRYDRQGNFLGFIGHCLDITGRKQAEEALRESEHLLRESQAVAGLGSYALDIPNGVWRSSPILDDIFGIAQRFDHSVAGWAALVAPADRAAMMDYFTKEVLGKRSRFDKEYRIIRPLDGAERWVHGMGDLGFDAQNQPARMVGTIQDITGRKQAEAALDQERNLLRTLIDNLPDFIFVKDTSGRFILGNRALAQSLGRTSPEEIVGKTDGDLQSPALAAQFRADEEAVLQSGQPLINREEFILDPEGNRRWLLTSKVPLRDPRGQVIGLVGVGRDITGRKQTERTLHDSQELYSSLMANLPQCVFRKDRAGHFQFCNARFCEVVGHSLAEIVGKTDADLFPPELAAAYRQDDLRVMESGQTLDQIEENVGADGRKLSVQVVKTPLRDVSGAVVGIQGIFWDVTGRKQAEAKLAYERNLLQSLMDASPDYIYFKDLQSRFIKCSTTLAAAFGLGHSSETLGKSDFDFFTDEQARVWFQDEQEVIRTGRPIIAKVEKETWKDGRKTKWALTTKVPLRNAAGEIIGTFGISKDITNIKEAEEKLEQVHKQLLETSRLAGMTEVATGVLHNVGNVLNSVNVSATLIGDTLRRSRTANLAKVAALVREHAADLGAFLTGDARGRQIPIYLGQLSEHLAAEQAGLMKEAANLQKNIEHIKDIVAMQQSYARVSGLTENLSPVELIEDALRMNAGSFERHEVEVRREFASGFPPVGGDKHKVLQILINLLRNAKYACDDSGRTDKCITVRASAENGRVCMSVADNGVGIPPENLNRIFNHGFTTRETGHGFGLHSGANAAKEMGGSLTVHSDGPGRGATFILELPTKPSQQLAA